MPEENIANVLSRMLPARTNDLTAEDVHPAHLQMDFTNPETKETLTIFSTTGDPHTKERFEQAMAQYEASGAQESSPSGFTVLKPDTKTHKYRTAFNAVTSKIREGAILGGERLASNLAPTGFAAAAEKLGIMQPGSAQSLDRSAQQFGAAEGSRVADLVKTPGAALTNIGTVATTPFLGPVTKAGAAGKMAVAPLAMLGNTVLQTLVGGAGANLAEMATGNTPKIKEAAANFAIAGINGGIQSVLSGLIGRYITAPARQKEVAESVLGEITKKYPNMLNNPQILDRYAGAEENLKKITTHMSTGIRGTLDDLTDDFMTNLGQVGKMNLTTGQQSTMRMHARNLGKHSKELLDNLGDKETIDAAQEAYSQTHKDMLKLVDNSNLTPKNKAALRSQVEDAFNKYTSEATNSIEGAQVLKYLEESGAGTGWNVNNFADVIRGKRTEPGSVLENVSKKLGFNLPGGLGFAAPKSAQVAEALGQAGASAVGGKAAMAAKVLSRLKGAGKAPVNTLPWQRATGRSPIPASASLYGQDAIRDFLQPDED